MDVAIMWAVRSELGDGTIGKVVTRSWLHAAVVYASWRLKGRPATVGRYFPPPQSWVSVDRRRARER